jgi:hypothetical protein
VVFHLHIYIPNAFGGQGNHHIIITISDDGFFVMGKLHSRAFFFMLLYASCSNFTQQQHTGRTISPYNASPGNGQRHTAWGRHHSNTTRPSGCCQFEYERMNEHL